MLNVSAGGSTPGTSGNNRACDQIDDCVQEVKMIEYFSTVAQTGNFNSKLIADAVDTMHICDALKKSIRLNQVIDLV